MEKQTKIKHVALTYKNKDEADTFFIKVLNLDFKKSFILSEDLTYKIFGIKQETKVQVYTNDYSYFEIFISKKLPKQYFDHTCIKVDSKENFIKRCKENKIDPIYVKNGEKILLFIKDYSGNLFEITE